MQMVPWIQLAVKTQHRFHQHLEDSFRELAYVWEETGLVELKRPIHCVCTESSVTCVCTIATTERIPSKCGTAADEQTCLIYLQITKQA